MEVRVIALWALGVLLAIAVGIAIYASLIPKTEPVPLQSLTPEQQSTMACDEIASQAKSWFSVDRRQFNAYVQLSTARECI